MKTPMLQDCYRNKGSLIKGNKGQSTLKRVRMERAWAEINLANLGHNINAFRRMLPNGCELMAVVKANALGHGDIEVARYLNRMGVAAFAVATIDEAVRLRTHGIKGDILIMGYTDPLRVSELARYHLLQTVTDYKYAEQLNSFGQQIRVHIKVDTGMHRLGNSWSNTSAVANIIRLNNLKIGGHFHPSMCRGQHTRG